MEVLMDSITKINLSSSEINVLVKNAFGKDNEVNKVEEFKDGWFNSIYSIELQDRREIVLKISPPQKVKILRYEKNIMKAEVEVLRLLKAKGKVPVPDVFFYDISRTLIDNDYFFMEKVIGQPFNKIKASFSEKEKENIEIELGAYNSLINDIKGKKFGYFAQPDTNVRSWSEAFFNMVKDILQDGEEYNVKLPIEYEEMKELIKNRFELLDKVTEPSLTHWDLHDGNVLVNESRITGIIDCDRAIWGDPLIEVYFGNFSDRTNFCKGYGTQMLNTEEEKCRRAIYNVYLCLIMVIESYYRGYDENHKKWTYKLLEEEINILKQCK